MTDIKNKHFKLEDQMAEKGFLDDWRFLTVT